MPKTDYDDPETTFPRLEARIQLLDNETYWLQVWIREQPGGPRYEVANGKRAGNANDAHEHLRKVQSLTSARCDSDDITVEGLPRNSN